jgi:hypothetical protein
MLYIILLSIVQESPNLIRREEKRTLPGYGSTSHNVPHDDSDLSLAETLKSGIDMLQRLLDRVESRQVGMDAARCFNVLVMVGEELQRERGSEVTTIGMEVERAAIGPIENWQPLLMEFIEQIARSIEDGD